jgi:uncharacterized OsmC-like protein
MTGMAYLFRMGNDDKRGDGSTPDGEQHSLGLFGNAESRPPGDRSAVDSGAIRRLRCRTVASGRFRQRHYIRDLSPLGNSGDVSTLLSDDVEPNPSESLLAALGSCLSICIHADAVARAIPIRQLEIELEADLDSAALWGTGDPAPKPLGFQEISIRVHINADVPRVVLKALIDHVALWSPVANTLHNPVHLDVVLA